MTRLPANANRVRLAGRVDEVRQRWTPDGRLAVIALLIIPRPQLGPARASVEATQPIPLRAMGRQAETLLACLHAQVAVEGVLRRRYYSRDGDVQWGQVEVWVETCRPIEEKQDD